MAAPTYGKELHTIPGASSKGNEIKAPAINLDKGGKRGGKSGKHAAHKASGHHPMGAGHMSGKR
jgi:hypothetical protein